MKKGSLNLSIQAIVIVVLGMTLLGLGLGFIRNQFQQISSVGTEVQEQVREQIVAQLRTSGEQVSFPRSVSMSRREQKVMTLGVQNVGSKEIKFRLDFTFDAPTTGNSDVGEGGPTLGFNLRYDRGCLTLLPAQSEVYGINVIAPSTPGTFALRASVEENPSSIAACSTPGGIANNEYATKLSFLTVG
jgi:hypothetical protein